MNVAVVTNDRYFGFFEPFLHEYDCVINMYAVFDVHAVKSITCAMTVQVVNLDCPFIKELTLWQTEQLSREREISRVVSEIELCNAKNIKLRVLDYSKANMRLLQDRIADKNLKFEHVFAPIVTPFKEVKRLKALLQSTVKSFDFAVCAGMSTRRGKIIDALKAAGHKILHIENSFGMERDVAISQCKALLNIHADDDFQVFETSRCMRWLEAGMTVVTEPSLDLEHFVDRFPNLICVSVKDMLQGKVSLHRENWIDAISSAWKGHRQFAEWLVKETQAKVIVDLGVDFGFSTFVFASAAKSHGGQVWGIDMFEGDVQTGARNTFEFVTQKKEKHALTNLHILRGDFSSFASIWTRQIDILHIDGLHTLEAVKCDFVNWSKFVPESGIVLFHDTQVQEYQVKDFFATLPADCKFEFLHSFGLGVFTRNKNLLENIKKFKPS